MEIKVEIHDEEVKRLFVRLSRDLTDTLPIMRRIAGIMADSVEENFAREGRPRWEPSKRAIRDFGQTLQKSGRLAASITQKATATEAMVGTNVKYAAVHQFGAKKGAFGTFAAKVKAHERKGVPVKAHTRNVKTPWGDIPARPFMMVQDEDWGGIKTAVVDYIEGKI